MKIYLKNDNYNFKLFQKLAHRLGLFQVFTRSEENILLEIDYGYEVNQNKKVYYLYTEKFLFDLIDICAKLQIHLILINEKNDNDTNRKSVTPVQGGVPGVMSALGCIGSLLQHSAIR